jgi:TolA-binding protein
VSWRVSLDRLLGRCPAGWRLTRAVSEPAGDPDLASHLVGCRPCADEHRRLGEIVDAAAQLRPPAEMPRAAREAIATRLLASSSRAFTTPRRKWVPALAGAAVLGAVFWLGLSRRSPAPPEITSPPASRASIRAVGAARFVRVAGPPDELVRLDEGTIVLEVRRLARGERFRVQTKDGVVEVRGTRFQVSAAGGALAGVAVSEGRVEVRSPGGARVTLDPGDEWVPPPPAPTDVAPISPPAAVVPETRTARLRTKPTDGGRTAKATFEKAWSRLRQGDPEGAARLFAEVEEVSRDRGIAEDALYWRAVAIARTGDTGEAARLFLDFSRRFPNASRGGQAATALGWILLERGDRDAAVGAFRRAMDDPSPNVRASATDGYRRASR